MERLRIKIHPIFCVVRNSKMNLEDINCAMETLEDAIECGDEETVTKITKWMSNHSGKYQWKHTYHEYTDIKEEDEIIKYSSIYYDEKRAAFALYNQMSGHISQLSVRNERDFEILKFLDFDNIVYYGRDNNNPFHHFNNCEFDANKDQDWLYRTLLRKDCNVSKSVSQSWTALKQLCKFMQTNNLFQNGANFEILSEIVEDEDY